MDSFELNKIAMAFLSAVVLIMGADFISQSIFHPRVPEQPGFAIKVVENSSRMVKKKSARLVYEPVAPLLADADVQKGAKADIQKGAKKIVANSSGMVKKKSSGLVYEPVAPLLANADIQKGAKVARKCASCHTFDKGGKKKIGPNLYGIVNRAIATNSGFGYSKALKAFRNGRNWDYATLNGFLFKPKKYVKGTSMGFAGLKKVIDRANIIGYLRSLSDNPAPLPGE